MTSWLFLLLVLLEMKGLYSLRMVSNRILRRKSKLTMKTTNILALDFDGVICASSPESSHSAIVAAKEVWPRSFESIDMNNSATYLSLQEEIMYLRPIIETGYENMLIARYLHENQLKGVMVEKQWNAAFRDQLVSNYEIPKVCFMRMNDFLLVMNNNHLFTP